MNREVIKFKSRLIAFSAPSGAGKTTIVQHLARTYPQTMISISATTRPRRANEEDGRDYFFMSRTDFKEGIKSHNFLEYELVHGNYYGTLAQTVESALDAGKVVLFDIDVNGALAIKDKYPETLLLFIKPPSEEELVQRLKDRNSETEESIHKRMQRLDLEYKKAAAFDHIIINDQLKSTLQEVEMLIINKEKTIQ